MLSRGLLNVYSEIIMKSKQDAHETSVAVHKGTARDVLTTQYLRVKEMTQ